MKPRLLSLAMLLFAVLACTLPFQPTATTPTPYDGGIIQPPAAVVQAQTDLAAVLGVTPAEITIRDIQSKVWSNSCLDAPTVEEVCAQQQTDGYQVILAYGEEIYTYHTDLTGIQLRRIQQVLNPSQAALEARALLAGMLGYNPETIRITSEENLRFQDSCLEISTPETVCSQVQVRGTRIELEVDDILFEFRSAENPVAPVLAMAAGVDAGQPVILISRDGGINRYCDNLNITLGKAIQYACAGVSGEVPGIMDLSAQDQAQLLKWVLKFSPFDTRQTRLDNVAIHLTFYGTGPEIAQFADQQEIQKFAEDQFKLPKATPTPLPTVGPEG